MARPPGLRIQGARQNNLKNVSLEIPHDRLTVVTGVSGSGKSSLAFDTLFAEGQWRYIESLSTYARMFLDRVDRPDVDKIEQIRPAVALEQKNPVRTARSTVGTATEIYDYLRLLYAKIGRVYCPACGAPAVSHSPESIVDALLEAHPGARAMITFRLAVPAGLPPAELWANLTRRGFARVRVADDVLDLAGPPPADFGDRNAIAVILDRVVLEAAHRARIVESVESALREGGGRLAVEVIGADTREFGEDFRCSGCGAALERPQPVHLSRVPRRAPQARRARRPRRRAHDRRVRRAHDRRGHSSPGRPRAHRVGSGRRAGDPAPAQRQAHLPPSRGARLPHALPADANPLGGRSPADQPREPAGLAAGRYPLRAGRAVHRPARAGYGTADRPVPGARPGRQHRGGRRARSRVHRRGRSHRRAGAGLRRARRRDRLQRLAGRVPEGDALAHRALRLRSRVDPGAAVPPKRSPDADARRRASAQPQGRDDPRPPAHAHRGVGGVGLRQVDPGARHPLSGRRARVQDRVRAARRL